MKISQDHLSVRTVRGLFAAGITTKAEAQTALDEHGDAFFLKIPHFGRKSLNELKLFLSFSTENREPLERRLMRCPCCGEQIAVGLSRA